MTAIFQQTPGTESPAEMNTYFPDSKALWMAENCNGSMHNLYTLRGAEVRDANGWARYITEAQSLFPDAEVVFQAHNWPHWGKETVNEYMTNTAAIYKFIHDQTLLYINEGYTSTEIASMIRLPEELEKVWYTRQYYGTLKHNVKAVYQKYMGWYDANPIHLDELTPSEYAKKLVEYLGDTIEKIAYEKAGIIKPGVPVIYFRRDEAAARVIEDTAKERGADIIPVEKSDYIINHLGNKTIDFSLHNRYYSYCNLQIQKTSLYQVENVSLAVTAFRMLMKRRNVPEQDIEKTVRNALLQFYWEGRMEEIAPHIYVDGAHNVEAVNAYIETMNRLHGEYDKILVFAAVKDKEYDSMIHLLAGNITFGRIIVTSVDSSRKADSAKLAEIFSACTDTPVMVSDEIDDAMDMAVELRGDRENTNIYCVGSLYLVGGVKRWRNRHDQF